MEWLSSSEVPTSATLQIFNQGASVLSLYLRPSSLTRNPQHKWLQCVSLQKHSAQVLSLRRKVQSVSRCQHCVLSYVSTSHICSALLVLLLLNYFFSFFYSFSAPIIFYSCSTLYSSFNYTTFMFISAYRSFIFLYITFRFAQYFVLCQYFYFFFYCCYSSTITTATIITAITSSSSSSSSCSSSSSYLTLPPYSYFSSSSSHSCDVYFLS